MGDINHGGSSAAVPSTSEHQAVARYGVSIPITHDAGSLYWSFRPASTFFKYSDNLLIPLPDTFTMSYYERPESYGYYSFTKTEDQLKEIGNKAVVGIPMSRNRIRDETEAKARMEYVLAHRRPVKTPYKVGDKIVYSRKNNYGTKKWPWIVVTVEYGYIAKITDLTVTIVRRKDYDAKSGIRVDRRFILARTK